MLGDVGGQSGPVAHGVLAVGDSWMTGLGLPLGGVSCWSWPAWLAWAHDDCLTVRAWNGVDATEAARDQLPTQRRYRIAAAMVGANDLPVYDPLRFDDAVQRLGASLAACTPTPLLATLPLGLRSIGQPWRLSVSRVMDMNVRIRTHASATGCLVVELEDALGGPWAMARDHLHPTALGQLEMAHAAAATLHAAGIGSARLLPDLTQVVPLPHERQLLTVSARERLRGRVESVRAELRRR